MAVQCLGSDALEGKQQLLSCCFPFEKQLAVVPWGSLKLQKDRIQMASVTQAMEQVIHTR